MPYGGAFNPALATLDLTDVERIEVIRSPAPVSYGATSFVGIIPVIKVRHRRDFAHSRCATTVSDVWLDSGASGTLGPQLQRAAGIDWLYGDGGQHSANFEYGVLPTGRNRPLSRALSVDELTRLDVERSFLSLYLRADWQATTRWKLSGGLRLNHTDENRTGTHIAGGTTRDDDQQRTKTRPSSTIGTSYLLYAHDTDYVTAFADWRSTFKPAAADLGPEAQADILKPESAKSYELGLRGRACNARLQWEASGFHMDFRNLVIRENIGGLPALANAGRERLRGGELEFSFKFTKPLQLRGSGAYHASRFVDYARLRGDGSNLTDRRDPVAESEIGDAQFYRLSGRTVMASVTWEM